MSCASTLASAASRLDGNILIDAAMITTERWVTFLDHVDLYSTATS